MPIAIRLSRNAAGTRQRRLDTVRDRVNNIGAGLNSARCKNESGQQTQFHLKISSDECEPSLSVRTKVRKEYPKGLLVAQGSKWIYPLGFAQGDIRRGQRDHP